MHQAELTILRGSEERTVPYERRFVVGSSPDADLTIDAPGVATEHIVIEEVAGWGTMVRPGELADDATPVELNGQELTQSRLLNHGDEVSLGDLRLVYRAPGGQPILGVFQVFQEEETRSVKLEPEPKTPRKPHPRFLPATGSDQRLSLFDTGQFTWLESATLLDRCLSAFHQVAKLCGRCSSENQLLDAILKPTAEGLLAHHGAVITRAGGELVKLFSWGRDTQLDGIAQIDRVLTEGRSVSDLDVTGRPVVAVPLLQQKDQDVEAALVFVRPPGGQVFGIDELELATSIGRQVGSALERIRLLKAQRQRELENERLQRRLETILGSIGEGLALVTWGGRVTPLNPQGRLLLQLVGWKDGEKISEDSPLMWLVERAQERRGKGRRSKTVRHDVSGEERVLEVSATLVEAMGAVVLVMRDVTSLRRMEARHRETERKLRGEILEAGAREQQRLGQDIHDGLCQTLVGAEMMIRMLGGRLSRQGLPEADEVTTIAQVLNDAAGEARDLARGLSPVALEAHGLRAALEELTARSSKVYGVACTLESRPGLLVPDPLVAIHLYYIAKEAIANAVSHGEPQKVVIRLSRDAEGVQLYVDDDGRGFTKPAPRRDRKRGMGFHIMGHRAEMIGAALEVENRASGGVRVSVFVPAGKLRSSEDDD